MQDRAALPQVLFLGQAGGTISIEKPSLNDSQILPFKNPPLLRVLSETPLVHLISILVASTVT